MIRFLLLVIKNTRIKFYYIRKLCVLCVRFFCVMVAAIYLDYDEIKVLYNLGHVAGKIVSEMAYV